MTESLCGAEKQQTGPQTHRVSLRLGLMLCWQLLVAVASPTAPTWLGLASLERAHLQDTIMKFSPHGPSHL